MSDACCQNPALPKLPRFLRVLHWVIIVNFVVNVIYGAYQVFFVLTPGGGQVGPLFGAANTIPPELVMLRRAYAAEVWLSIVGVCLYLAITEYLPRLLRRP
ncbi:MAG: hypothetical protein JRI68_29085 [Deltaproteobacteria bacterium]|nr:hypothetical protein [Deltaproteobacteria bacterium]